MGIAGESDCDVCVSRWICHLFFGSAKPTLAHCCVPCFSNGRRTSPSLSYHSFPLSSELRKRWLAALRRDKGANFRVSKSTILCVEHFPSTDFHFPARAQESFGSHITDHGKPRKASRFPRACRCSAIGFFSPAALLLAPVGMEWAWTMKQRKALPERKRAVDSR